MCIYIYIYTYMYIYWVNPNRINTNNPTLVAINILKVLLPLVRRIALCRPGGLGELTLDLLRLTGHF